MRQKVEYKYYIIAVIMIVIAYLLLAVGELYDAGYPYLRSLIRLVIHLGLIIAWAYSVQIRVIQPKICRYLTTISILMIFWLIIRFIKWNHCTAQLGQLYIWYLYYIPIVFIPFFAVLASKNIRQSNSASYNKLKMILYTIGTILVLLILTNNLHGLAFSFNDSLIDKTSNIGKVGTYRHGIVYYMVLLWDMLCIAEMLRTIFKKSRILNIQHRKLLIYSSMVIIIYAGLYLVTPGGGYLHRYMKDMTVVYCLFTMLIFEICFSCHLIPNNCGYKNLFLASTLNAAINNPNEDRLIYSSNLHEFSKEVLEESKRHPVIVDQYYRVSSYPVLDGFVYWEEDISELLENISELEDMKQELSDKNVLSQMELDIERRKQKAIILSKLYDRIQKETSKQINKLFQLTEQFHAETDEEEKKHILWQIVIIGTYLKRRNNLVLLSESETMISVSELLLSLQESMNILELTDINTYIDCSVAGMISFTDIAALYDFYELVVEEGIASASAIVVHILDEDDGLAMIINIDSKNNLFLLDEFPYGVVDIESDDDEWCLRLMLEGEVL